MLLFQLPDEVNAQIDPVGLEIDEIQATAVVRRVQFPGKIYQLRERASNLNILQK
jgi:hypothetical protein